MLRSIFVRTIRASSHSVLGWTIGTVALTSGLVALYPFIRDSVEMEVLLEEMPLELMSAFGIDPDTFLTAAGYLAAQMYSFIGPIIMIGFAVSLGVAVTAREEHEGTLDMLLAAPISRAAMVYSKLGASALMAGVVPVSMAGVLLAANNPVGLALPIRGILSVNAGLWLLGLSFLGITVIVGAFTGKPGTSRGVAILAAVLAWFLTAFEPLFDWLAIPSSFSPFSWYLGSNPILEPSPTGYLWMALSVTMLVLGAVELFKRRDIATELAVLPDTPLTRRRSNSIGMRSVFLLESVAGKTIWDRRRTVFAWAAGIASLLVVTFAAWPAVSGSAATMEAMLGAMPTEMFAVFGMTDVESLATPSGFISSRAYLNMGPLIMIIFCVGAVSSVLPKEEQSGVLDMVLSNPRDRRSVLLGKVGAIAALAIGVSVILMIVGFVGNAVWDTELEPINIVGANLGLAFLGLFFGGLALALWSLPRLDGMAVGITSAFAVVAYFLNGLGSVVEVLSPFRPFSPFYWYIGDVPPLAKGIDPLYLLLVAGALSGALFATWRFDQRDLAV